MSAASRLTEVRALRDRGLTGQYVAEARALAKEHPGDVHVRMEAACACDVVGDEGEAIVHYDEAWRLGVPDDERATFAVAYGCTLRDVGRIDEAIAILGEALIEFPDYVPIKVSLALALHSGKHHHAAMATALQAILELAEDDRLDGFEGALAEYQTELTTASLDES